MDKYTVESKIYIVPTKVRRVLRFLMNFVWIFYALVALFTIIMEGFDLSVIGNFCLVTVVIKAFDLQNKPAFQFSILDIEISPNQVNLLFKGVKVGRHEREIRYEILPGYVDKIEYSERANAIKFSGRMTKIINQKREAASEAVIYSKDEAYSIIASIENNFNCKVTCLE